MKALGLPGTRLKFACRAAEIQVEPDVAMLDVAAIAQLPNLASEPALALPREIDS